MSLRRLVERCLQQRVAVPRDVAHLPVFRETGRFETLQRYGASRARAVGVTTEQDVQRLIEEARRT
jgi:hypothetical protein